jgi:hypothetical protein
MLLRIARVTNGFGLQSENIIAAITSADKD